VRARKDAHSLLVYDISKQVLPDTSAPVSIADIKFAVGAIDSLYRVQRLCISQADLVLFKQQIYFKYVFMVLS